jgi:hypothetical protein
VKFALGSIFCLLAAGCAAPSDRLTFPQHPLSVSSQGIFYDVHHHGRADFALLTNSEGRVESVAYDDAGSGKFNRVYRLDEYANQDVPHLIILLDSIPFQAILDRYKAGEFRWCDPPQKVIPPFPSLTEVCYSRLLDAPPLSGFVDDYYDRDTREQADTMWRRVLESYREPWERRLDYDMSLYDSGLAYLHPREWYDAELALAKKTFDQSPRRVTLVYLGSASGMLSKYGKDGLKEVLDGIERMCVQVLYERQGAVKITLMADHGHNLKATANVDLAPSLAKAGFHVTGQLRGPKDVVLELQGLVTYTGVRTNSAAAVAKALAACPQVNLAIFQEGTHLIVRNAHGDALIEQRQHRLRYLPIDYDVLGYEPLIAMLRDSGKVDGDGFISDDDWFSATLDHEYPDGPRRLWDAFHGGAVNPPEVMVTVRDGYAAGRKEFERFIKMASTHGSLNQVNSASFVMSMTGRVNKPLRTGLVMSVIEPGFVPTIK